MNARHAGQFRLLEVIVKRKLGPTADYFGLQVEVAVSNTEQLFLQ
jgi:hypothetical protein